MFSWFWTWVPLKRMRDFRRERDEQIVRDEETREAEGFCRRKMEVRELESMKG